MDLLIESETRYKINANDAAMKGVPNTRGKKLPKSFDIFNFKMTIPASWMFEELADKEMLTESIYPGKIEIAVKDNTTTKTDAECDLLDVFSEIISTTTTNVCQSLSISVDSLHTHRDEAFFVSLLNPADAKNIEDVARHVLQETAYIGVFSNGMKYFELVRKSQINPTLNMSLFHAIHGLSFARNSLVHLKLENVGLGIHEPRSSLHMMQELCERFIKHNHTLKHLDLKKNNLTDTDVILLSKTLKTCSLHSLDLSDNAGLTEFSLYTVVNVPRLRELGINNIPGITKENTVQYIEGMKKNGFHNVKFNDRAHQFVTSEKSPTKTDFHVVTKDIYRERIGWHHLILAGKLKQALQDKMLYNTEADFHVDSNRAQVQEMWKELKLKDKERENSRFGCQVVWLTDDNVFQCMVSMTLVKYEIPITYTKKGKDIVTTCILYISFDPNTGDIPFCVVPDEDELKKLKRHVFDSIHDTCRLIDIEPVFVALK